MSWAVIVNNVAALEILMDCGYARAGALVAIAAACRAAVSWAILSAVGLGEKAVGEMGWEGLIGFWKDFGT